MPTPAKETEKQIRISVFVPVEAIDKLEAIAAARAEHAGVRAKDPELWREAIMRGLGAMSDATFGVVGARAQQKRPARAKRPR